MGCGCTWHRYLFLETKTRATTKFQHLTRAEEVVTTQLRIGHTKAHILSRGPPTTCHHCDQTLTIDHMLLECAVLQESCEEYYTADSLNTLFETISETCIVEFLREAGFFFLIWTARHSIQYPTWIIPELIQYLTINQPSDLGNMVGLDQFVQILKQISKTSTHVGWLICLEGHVSSLLSLFIVNQQWIASTFWDLPSFQLFHISNLWGLLVNNSED